MGEPNLFVEYVKMDLPIRVGFWRSVGNTQNAFVKETFVDELAYAAKKDPLEFRLNHLKNPGARRVLQLAAEKAGWKNLPKKGKHVELHITFPSEPMSPKLLKFPSIKRTER